MAIELKPSGFIQSFKKLQGNTKTSVIFEPLWGIPYSLYTFYFSLYMKDRGISDQQIGFLIAIGFIASIAVSAVAGLITDAMGRRRTTLIFDFLSWPLALMIYLISNNFWLFAIAQIINSLSKIPAVSWNLMLIEDASPDQQVAAYNLINTINISVGIFTPLAGIIVRELGILSGERILLGFAVVSMSIMILCRNYYYRETAVGQQILHQRNHKSSQQKNKLNKTFIKALFHQPMVFTVLCCSILFNAYIPIGTFSSLYYAPFLTEVLKLDKSVIAVLGGVSAAVMFMIFVLVIPRCSHLNRYFLMAGGVLLQIVSLIFFITLPAGSFIIVFLCAGIFAIGYGLSKPFIDAVLAEATYGTERAAIFAIHNTAVAIFSAIFGFLSGFLYGLHPALLYMLSIGILVVCMGTLTWLGIMKQRKTFQTTTISE
jgi:MFS family permease